MTARAFTADAIGIVVEGQHDNWTWAILVDAEVDFQHGGVESHDGVEVTDRHFEPAGAVLSGVRHGVLPL